jgi:hypothetical protein
MLRPAGRTLSQQLVKQLSEHAAAGTPQLRLDGGTLRLIWPDNADATRGQPTFAPGGSALAMLAWLFYNTSRFLVVSCTARQWPLDFFHNSAPISFNQQQASVGSYALPKHAFGFSDRGRIYSVCAG